MTLRALSLWQLWGSAVAEGHKLVETRHWSTKYRGDIAICGAKRPTRSAEVLAIGAAMPKCEARTWVERWRDCDHADEFGAVLCVATLTDVLPIDNEGTFGRESMFPMVGGRKLMPTLAQPAELELGDYSDGRFAWLLADVRTLERPVPVVGRQALFTLPADVEAAVRAQLTTAS